jgi:hypothetical protein
MSVLAGWTAGQYLAGHAERQAMQRAQAMAAQFADRLDQAVWAGAREFVAFAAEPSIADPALRDRHARPMLDSIRRALPSFHWVGVADASGRIVRASGGEHEGLDVAGQLAYRQARLAKRVAGIEDAVLAPRIASAAAVDRPFRFLDLSVATFDGDGAPSGVLLGQLGWDWSAESPGMVAVGGKAGTPRGEVLVVTAEGLVVMSTDPAMAGRLVDTRIGDGGAAGGASGRWPDGHRYQTVAVQSQGYRDFSGLGWIVVLRQPLDEALGAWRHLPVAGAAAGALLCALALSMSARLRRRPR